MPSSAWRSTLFPYTTLFRSDRKSTRLNSSHDQISYAVFCLKKKKQAKRHANHHHTQEMQQHQNHVHAWIKQLQKSHTVLSIEDTYQKHPQCVPELHSNQDL